MKMELLNDFLPRAITLTSLLIFLTPAQSWGHPVGKNHFIANNAPTSHTNISQQNLRVELGCDGLILLVRQLINKTVFPGDRDTREKYLALIKQVTEAENDLQVSKDSSLSYAAGNVIVKWSEWMAAAFDAKAKGTDPGNLKKFKAAAFESVFRALYERENSEKFAAFMKSATGIFSALAEQCP